MQIITYYKTQVEKKLRLINEFVSSVDKYSAKVGNDKSKKQNKRT